MSLTIPLSSSSDEKCSVIIVLDCVLLTVVLPGILKLTLFKLLSEPDLSVLSSRLRDSAALIEFVLA